MRGHQDDSKELKELNTWEQLNIKADYLAKAQLWDHIEEGQCITKVPEFKTTMPLVTIKINNELIAIASRTLRTLHTILTEQGSLTYWSKVHPITQENVDLDSACQ